MIHRRSVRTLTFLFLSALYGRHLLAQASPSAYRPLELTAFGGASAVYTGLLDGKNLSITAGADLSFRSIFHLRPAIEVRGSYPVDSGDLLSQKDVLGGVRLAHTFGRMMPYGDILFGRGEIKYIHGFVDPSGSTEYLENPSNVLSGGGGVDFSVTNHFSLKADAQYQRFNTPVTTSGHIYTKPLTLALVYRFNADHYPRR